MIVTKDLCLHCLSVQGTKHAYICDVNKTKKAWVVKCKYCGHKYVHAPLKLLKGLN